MSTIWTYFFQFRRIIKGCFPLYNLSYRVFGVVFFMISGSIMISFHQFLWLKSIIFKNTFWADLVDAFVSHRWSMDACIPRYIDFLGALAVFEISISINGHCGSIDGYGEKWCRAFMDHPWSIDCPSVGVPWTTDGHQWDPTDSRYEYLRKSYLRKCLNIAGRLRKSLVVSEYFWISLKSLKTTASTLYIFEMVWKTMLVGFIAK